MATQTTPSSTSSLSFPKSRYVLGGTTDQTSNRLGWWERTIWQFQDDDQQITLTNAKYVGRADLIAADYLGSEEYEWLVLQYNTILFPLKELVLGVNIRLPALSRL
jgi:hypothetical protein